MDRIDVLMIGLWVVALVLVLLFGGWALVAASSAADSTWTCTTAWMPGPPGAGSWVTRCAWTTP